MKKRSADRLDKLTYVFKTTVCWLIALGAAFLLLHALATVKRGYEALGWEILVFVYPLIYYAAKAVFGKWFRR